MLDRAVAVLGEGLGEGVAGGGGVRVRCVVDFYSDISFGVRWTWKREGVEEERRTFGYGSFAEEADHGLAMLEEAAGGLHLVGWLGLVEGRSSFASALEIFFLSVGKRSKLDGSIGRISPVYIHDHDQSTCGEWVWGKCGLWLLINKVIPKERIIHSRGVRRKD